MKFLNIILLSTYVAAAAVRYDINRRDSGSLVPRHHRGAGASGNNNGNQNANGRNRGGNQGDNQGAGQGDNQDGDAASGDDAAVDDGTQTDNGSTDNTTTGDTLVLKEVGGVPGNECLTFRNNGEIVDAACVNEAADRQMTPGTINGASALQVQRAFSAGFRADLVGVQACVGFNGTHFRASDCSDPNVELVSLAGGELRSTSGACASGHDGLAQMTVDPSGQSCAQFETTAVTPTPP
ncbi:hypothetical protein SAMD00023353_2601080 [Rosellinia necatrix]|uniref:Uncharacterized protein n=1 Tax=Rosellinia necatrix TaxID=77044 RepID=A0A1W2TH52_ROSNE|nr:hypothetical protein SAMD00023353_2601080 [Rosellinia necatrix]